MHSDIAISVKNLTKTYRIFGHPADRIKQALTFGRVRFHNEFTALQDVSFEIKKGETVGIIGRNGSGKSTLLQLICGILKPTAGEVQINGRVSALLELGSGFNPDFTGRENIHFQGAVMGFTQQQMNERLDDIIAFADIGDFIDQPVRTYSSGMFVRLAFAVAVSVDPEILVVDEALSVGDAGFQSKCFRRLAALKKNGCTILFVTHATEQVIRTCDRAMMLDGGSMIADDVPKLVVGNYHKLLAAPDEMRGQLLGLIHASTLSGQGNNKFGSTPGSCLPAEPAGFPDETEGYDPDMRSQSTIAYSSNAAIIESPRLLTLDGIAVNRIFHGRSYDYVYNVHIKQDVTNLRFGMLIKTPTGIELGGATTAATLAEGLSFAGKGTLIQVEFRFNCSLNPGVYFLNAGVTGIVDNEEIILHRLLDAEMFKVIPVGESTATAMIDFGCSSEIKILGRAHLE